MMNSPVLRHSDEFEYHQDRKDESRVRTLTIWALAIGLIGFFAWAYSFELEEITRGQGRVIPVSKAQVVQSLDAGILTELNVREGDSVKAGQQLLRIDDARSGPMYREAVEKWLGLSAQASRLRAEALGKEIEFGPELDDHPQIMARELAAYAARRQALDEQVMAMERSMALISREIEMVEPLVNKGVISEVEVLRLSRQRSDIQAGIAERKNRYYTDANNELVKVETEMAMARENALARQDAFKRTVIRAPMDGVVKNIQVTTLGAVVPAGQDILEIIPTHDEMVVEAFVEPTEVAFLEIGQPVMVKLSAYDFNKYGGIHGRIMHISADTLQEQNPNRPPPNDEVQLEPGLYKVLVGFVEQGVTRHGKALTPMPGMTADIEVKTGNKTVLEYVFRPLMSVREALRER
ncbi:HlyD family efflux transporter periplasmic adaptor subunit [Orrella daihaiensis]|uniref:HlyD family efflux transporter periplasmic adaptor subunit n=1 Tax=Orrella daihaiensis TaxID=2782176 RepID=A0ABY4AHL9_9BURK|nr:HlyD family efflux transporter periplasmic adaptor subunit [Orrella daihaiensis]UOD49787.1 HlyD family efflux transporter periplasmic adaptor subunit [Orrella daihaiensis]